MAEGGTKQVEQFYERIRQGDHSLLENIDYKIMELCPPEGTNFGDLYMIGTTSKEMGKKFGGVPSSLLIPRLRMMAAVGFIVAIHMIGTNGSRAWQITPKGQEVLEVWKQSQ